VWNDASQKRDARRRHVTPQDQAGERGASQSEGEGGGGVESQRKAEGRGHGGDTTRATRGNTTRTMRGNATRGTKGTSRWDTCEKKGSSQRMKKKRKNIKKHTRYSVTSCVRERKGAVS
jgi:hypothetical protein